MIIITLDSFQSSQLIRMASIHLFHNINSSIRSASFVAFLFGQTDQHVFLITQKNVSRNSTADTSLLFANSLRNVTPAHGCTSVLYGVVTKIKLTFIQFRVRWARRLHTWTKEILYANLNIVQIRNESGKCAILSPMTYRLSCFFSFHPIHTMNENEDYYIEHTRRQSRWTMTYNYLTAGTSNISHSTDG